MESKNNKKYIYCEKCEKYIYKYYYQCHLETTLHKTGLNGKYNKIRAKQIIKPQFIKKKTIIEF